MPIPMLINGELPTGEHLVTLKEIEMTFGSQNDRRKNLMTGLNAAASQFKDAGVSYLLIDGSFTTDKDEPADIDGCWSASGDIDETKIDSDFWDFDTLEKFEVSRARIKSKYGLDFFIAELIELGSGKPFSDFFQTNRDGQPKGILKVIL